MAYGDLKVRNLIWNTGSGDNTVVLSTLATQSYVTTNFAPKANPTFSGTINGADLILSGNLTVNGTQTIINTQTLDVEDKQIEIGKVSSPSDTTANEGGWKLKGASDKTFLWYNSTDAWTSSEHIQVASGKTFIGDGSTLTALNATNLASGTVPTARLGTGTAGSSNFLRGDGSWQAIATDKIEEGNTSVETVDTGSDGHVKISTEGTERIRVLDNGNVGIGTNAPSWPLEVKGIVKHQATNSTNGFLAYTHTDNTYRLNYNGAGNDELVIKDTGAVAFSSTDYGSSGQVLTSGGSSAAPSWTTISAAPEVALTASEAITAEDAIMVKTNGQAEKITGVNSGLSAIQNLDSMNQGNACICYDENANQWVALFYDRENSDRLTGKVGTISNGSTITWGNKCQISTDLTDSDSSKNNIEMVYNPALSRITYFTRNGSQNGRTKCGHLTVSGTGTSATVSNAHSNNIANNNSQHRRAVYGSSQLKLLCVYGESTARPQIMRIDVSSLTSINDADRMDVTSYNTGYSGPDIAYNGSCYAVSFRNNTSKPAVACLRHYTFSWVGNITEISSSSIASSYTAPKIAWDSVNDKFLAIYNTSQGLVGDIFTANSSGTVTSGAEWLISSDDHTDMGLYELSYNAVAGKFIVVYTGKSSTNTYLRMMKYNSSTNQCDMDAQIQIQNSATSDFATVGNDPDNNVFGILYNRDNTSQKLGNSVVYTPSNTNMDPARFVGFAKSSVSSGAEVTVKINSNTSTRSGLTPASSYYVQGDGSLGTTASGDGTIKAGIALSSTKLLIKG